MATPSSILAWRIPWTEEIKSVVLQENASQGRAGLVLWVASLSRHYVRPRGIAMLAIPTTV